MGYRAPGFASCRGRAFERSRTTHRPQAGDLWLPHRRVPGGWLLPQRKKDLPAGSEPAPELPLHRLRRPGKPAAEDARILQEELHCTAVRTSHYPQSPYFLDECDRRGLLVFTELPGWQHIGDAAWKDAACAMLQEMILQNRNHPSIILWGVRINESVDDDASTPAPIKLPISWTLAAPPPACGIWKKAICWRMSMPTTIFPTTAQRPAQSPKRT